MNEVSLNSAAGLRPDSAALERCAQALASCQRVLLTMHEFPDGDALGSALSLALALESSGKQVVVYSPQGAPQNLRFLPGAERIVRSLAASERFDACIACDAGDLARLGPDLPSADRRGLVVNLDHHPRSKPFGDINVVDPQAASVGVLVHRLLVLMGHSLTTEIATCLWVSLATDTGNFRHSNTNAECLRIACALVERGVRPGEVASRMYESQPLSRVRLLSEVLKTLSVSPCGQYAWITAARQDFEAAGTHEETADGFISYPRSIAGVEVALLFREESPGRSRVSLRSRGKVDVGAIAVRFGGGGHHNASGCSVEGTLDEVRAHVLREVEKALARR